MLNHPVSIFVSSQLYWFSFQSMNKFLNIIDRSGDIPLSINDSTTPNEDGENVDLRNHFDGRLDVIFSDGDRRIDVDQFWEMNYHEASIFLEVPFVYNLFL